VSSDGELINNVGGDGRLYSPAAFPHATSQFSHVARPEPCRRVYATFFLRASDHGAVAPPTVRPDTTDRTSLSTMTAPLRASVWYAEPQSSMCVRAGKVLLLIDISLDGPSANRQPHKA
jgi:hypothetical protein